MDKVIEDIYEKNNADKIGQGINSRASIDEYIHLVPYVEDEKEIFLKTIIPSRKATKQYLA